MKKKMVRIFAVSVIALGTLFVSCDKDTKKEDAAGKSAVTWTTSFEKAKKQATAKNREIFILFSGDDWVDSCIPFKQKILYTKEFAQQFGKKFVFLNIDFSQKEYALADVAEDASKKEKRAAEKIAAEYADKTVLAMTYNVRSYPAVYILTPEGYVISQLPVGETVPEYTDFADSLASVEETCVEFRKYSADLNKTSGVEKIAAIKALYENTLADCVTPLRPLVEEVAVLDPENKSGERGLFDLYQANFLSYDEAVSGGDVAEPFVNAVNLGNMNVEQQQNAWFTAAFMLAYSNSTDFDRMLEYLNNSYDLDPTGEHADTILNAIAVTKNMKEKMGAQ